MNKEKINKNHINVFKSTAERLLFYGGAGSGKSYTIADKIIIYCLLHKLKNKKTKVVIIRKSFPSLRRTCWELLLQRLIEHSIPYTSNKQESVITIEESKIYFLSMNNPIDYAKMRSITDVSMIWIEEADELQLSAFEVIDLRMRGNKDNPPLYRQLILTYNPVSKNNWIYETFFLGNKYPCEKIQTNYKSNPYINPEYVTKLENLKEANYNLWQCYCNGEWGELEETVYNNYTITNKDVNEGYTVWGLDFGYNNPSALVKITINDNNYYVRQKLYKTKLTNNDLINELKRLRIKDMIYCDSAEPDRIKELEQAGFNVCPAEKNVKDGILYVKTKKLILHEDDTELIKEISSYSYEKKGETITENPIKLNDHLLDAMRYAIYTSRQLDSNDESFSVVIDDSNYYY